LIYICIPTHNEQQTVGVVLWKLRQVLTEFPRDYQLLVADDASTDKTLDVLEPYTRVLPLTVIRSEKRQGWAASTEMLLREAVRRSEYPKRDVVITLQADFSEEPEDVVALIKRMEAGADVVVGVKVSTSKEPRVRRLARTLSRFFARRHSWPEGVATPFDGYRAYRLYAVKHAMEDRQGQRLIRYEGWAGQAELLRAVLPHARRVEALEVEDRTDRLQRPRREKPLAAAWQVRAMASGAEPARLHSVEELDRTAATASRSRERSLVGDNSRAARDNGGSRSRASEPRARRERSERPDRGERQERGRSGRGEKQPRSEGGRQRQPTGERAAAGPAEGRRRQRAPRARDTASPEASEDPTLTAPVPEGEAAPAKKRRRRRRSRGAPSETSAVENNGATDTVDEGADAGAEAGAESADGGEAAQPKRRRRGGRRGGRSRRRPSAASGTDGDGEPGASGAAGEPVGAPAPSASAEPRQGDPGEASD
jgi:hypothetical protein